MTVVSVTEVVRDLLDVIDNENGTLHGNRRDLALLDADSVDRYITALQEQIEETEYILYNAEDWADDVVSIESDKLENQIREEIEMDEFNKSLLTDILDDYTKDLQKQIAKQVMIELAKVPQVYTQCG